MLIKEESGKINFIDEKDNFVGFDYQSSCCENFGFEITDSNGSELIVEDNPDIRVFEGFIFNTDKEPEFEESDRKYDSGGAVTFELINSETEEKIFLTLYNSHNGYYSHGWRSSFAEGGYL